MRRAERDRGGEVVDHLRDDARKIDGIDAREPHAVAEAVVVEHRLHDRLAIVEGAVDRQRVHVGVVHTGDHAALHLGDTPLRKQHEQVRARAAAKRFHRRAAGIARSRDHHGDALAARRQHMIHEPAEQLHREILECQRRPVKQLEHKIVSAELGQRRHRGMTKTAVGFARHAGELVLSDRLPHERPDHLDRHLRIRPPGKFFDGAFLEPRPALRHIKAAIAREPRERHLDEVERRSLAAGGDVAHGRAFPCASPLQNTAIAPALAARVDGSLTY